MEKYSINRYDPFHLSVLTTRSRFISYSLASGYIFGGKGLYSQPFSAYRRDPIRRHICSLVFRFVTMIHVRQLVKNYKDIQSGQFTALDGISFDAMPGQIYGLLGPNGAGKTTALRILSTVLRPTSGSATVNGFRVDLEPGCVRRQIGFVSTNTAIYDRMTAWEMILYFGQLYDMELDELHRRMETLFKRFQMNEIRNVLCSKMSTGMKQKVSIVRAMIHDPPVLIFDEATSGLDILVAREVLKTIEQLREYGKCIVFSTHIMSEVSRLCDRVAIMNRGNILAEGTIPELSDKYGEDDVEELFYQMISESELRHDAELQSQSTSSTVL